MDVIDFRLYFMDTALSFDLFVTLRRIACDLLLEVCPQGFFLFFFLILYFIFGGRHQNAVIS